MKENRKFERQQFEKNEDKGFEKAVGIVKTVGGIVVGIGVFGGGLAYAIVKHDPALLEKGMSMITRKKL